MSRLLAELEIDSAIEDFLRDRGTGNPQPVVTILDAMPPDEDEPDPDWDELTAKAMVRAPGETCMEMAERLLDRMGL